MSGARPGVVYLVGAGPGDPELLTLRGAELLRTADVVVYDALASAELLEWVPPTAERINVGKRGHDAPTRDQSEINALLVALARTGRRVVRLKGGDPFVFGRGGEEMSALFAAGISCEVVPGVSSAIGALAYAGIPITDRRCAASFAVVTGHKDPTEAARHTRWEALARAVDTLVVLMGLAQLEKLVERLLAGGRDPATPSAAVMWGTLPYQRVVVAPLAELPARVRAAELKAPVAVVVGDVVSLRESLLWFEKLPLFGLRVLLTRAREQASDWISALRRAGAEPECIPLLRFVPPLDPAPLAAALGRLADYDALVFSSPNAVRFVAECTAARGRGFLDLRARVLCLGAATAAAAREAGLPVHWLPSNAGDSAAFVSELVRVWEVSGKRFLVPQSDLSRSELVDGLRRAGARVDGVVAYRNVSTDFDAGELSRRLVAGEFAALVFASPSAVQRFAAALDAPARAATGRCIVTAIGPTTATALGQAGFPLHGVAASPAAEDLIAVLVKAVEQRRGMRQQ